MNKRGYGIAALGILAYVFREPLMAMLPWQIDGFSLPAILIATFGGIAAFFLAYYVVLTAHMSEVWHVTSLIIFSGGLSSSLGRWLSGFAGIGDFWGGFVTGMIETAVLTGALYGAKKIWSTEKR